MELRSIRDGGALPCAAGLSLQHLTCVGTGGLYLDTEKTAGSRMLTVQFQSVEGTDLKQFYGPGKRVVLYPEEWKSGTLIYPYAKARK